MVSFVVALIQRQVLVPPQAAQAIFSTGEMGCTELESRPNNRWKSLDQSARGPILYFLLSSVGWLLLGSTLGLIVSIKFHHPEFLGTRDFLTFGKLRTLHLNIIAYGWLSFAGLGLSLWLVPRIMRVPLHKPKILYLAGSMWNFGVCLGCLGILSGYTDGLEWLEFWWPIDGLLAVAGALVAIPLFQTIWRSQEKHFYVTMWYTLAAFIWFPVLFVIANMHFLHTGVQQGIVNWWFAHNVLGLWVTPLGLGIVYYLLPKITGYPIFSYQLSLFGFWGLALFYSQVGAHHLLGSPIPTWVANLSIVMSVGMAIPVITVAINHHVSAYRHLGVLRQSVVLRFIVFGAMMYTVSSLQGSLHSLRTFNYISHFTHWTVSHAHLGLYGFTSMVFFGGIYFALPRLLDRDWEYPGLINLHFWLAATGILTYAVSLGIGGILQGMALRDSSGTFEQSLKVTLPYLVGRSLGGSLMLLSHLVFAFNICDLLGRTAREKRS
ncbi:MAG: cbb3-type cytochrome c oxidase subunit I [Candidatus Eremiobacteraeota bacterium]|nr:cbb3-type cytochrome c oxidase subunit I [Candidatus Eremiobacteraeota bacterium]MCW5872390.1 cbb3-type cytochrome c oxidase subunit I [Candidatus Eremiobacteraeota bacterium]